MADPFYPTIDFKFIEDQVLVSGKVIQDSKIQVGRTTLYVLEGPQSLHKRTILIRQLTTNQVSFEQASGLAIKLNFLGPLLTWMEENRNWKDGGYIVQASSSEIQV